MSDPNKIVGHKTFATGKIGADGFPVLRHEPLTRAEADALWTAAEAAEKKRDEDMPTEETALRVLTDAHHRLKKLGWQDPTYAHELKREGVEALLIELGSSGVHRGYYHGVNGKDVWWIGPEGWPSHPCLVKPINPADTTGAKG